MEAASRLLHGTGADDGLEKPAAVNPENPRGGDSAEIAHYPGRIRPTAQAPAIRQRRSLKKTV